jgi:hypothetical protein
MDQQQRKLRQAAAREFMESLEQLEQTLLSSQDKPSPGAASAARSNPGKSDRDSTIFSPEALEEAAADLEQFMDEQDATDSSQTQD